jgi:hypothetical protein
MSKARHPGLICAVLLLLVAGDATAQARDGSRDFDFLPGTWHTHIKRVLDPLEGGGRTVTMDGTVTERKVANGHAWLEEISVDGPDGHWDGVTMFLYNPKSGQWSQTYAGATDGQFSAPTIGSFRDGTGQLYGIDTYNGRQVLLRGTWSGITPDAHEYTESYSNDGGKTWAPAFIAHLTRVR